MEIVPGVMLTAYLEDMQGRFNVNSLVDATGRPNLTQVAVFKALLAAVGLEDKWAGLLVDWIDVDAVPSIPDGAEDSTYLGQTPPYLTANRYITSTTELMALPGFDRAALRPDRPVHHRAAPRHAAQCLHRLRARCWMPTSVPATRNTAAPSRQPHEEPHQRRRLLPRAAGLREVLQRQQRQLLAGARGRPRGRAGHAHRHRAGHRRPAAPGTGVRPRRRGW